jgi:hypothetical protein
VVVDAFKELSKFKLVVISWSDRLDEGFFFFFLIGEVTPPGDCGGSCA